MKSKERGTFEGPDPKPIEVIAEWPTADLEIWELWFCVLVLSRQCWEI